MGDDGEGVVEVEMDVVGDEAETYLSAAPDAPRRVRTLFDAVDGVVPVLRGVVERTRAHAGHPDELEIHVGLAVGGETGLVLTKGTAQATFSLRMVWRREGASGRTAVAGHPEAAS